MKYLEKSLFDTEAIKVADAKKPFWYTSGTIGPFFVNTQYLYGGKDSAGSLLKFIDGNLDNRESFTKNIYDSVTDFYKTNPLFMKIMDEFYDSIKNDDRFTSCDLVSGGERRDWFFSPVISMLSGKGHLFIFKDLELRTTEKKIGDLSGKSIAHIADLINQASSYERAWIPAVENLGGKLAFSASVVDRAQGGKEFLNSRGIGCISPVIVNGDFFNHAMSNGVINNDQLELIKMFVNDPNGYGKKFILDNPDFLRASLASDEKSVRSKAERCVKENPYGLDFGQLGI